MYVMVGGMAKLLLPSIADLGTVGQDASDSRPEIAWIVA
jgi:hypothetical protein